MMSATTTPAATTVPWPGQDGDAVLKGRDWVLSMAGGHSALDVLYGAQCAKCKEASAQESGTARPVQVWMMQHTRAHPSHRSYLSTERRRWRVDPNTGGPAVAVTTEPPIVLSQLLPATGTGGRSQGGRTRHARPRPPRCRRMSAFLRRTRPRGRRTWKLPGLLALVVAAGGLGVVFCVSLLLEVGR
ncbi:DUF7848 domain-containing protein [Streptomyces odontomachi]|uniref:DUF7848 domain-containing protein n=1 Tax=Streptomyces odontomachi TaxID=2944940 RepID=UPI00403EF3D0